jgi:hypothetical protein
MYNILYYTFKKKTIGNCIHSAIPYTQFYMLSLAFQLFKILLCDCPENEAGIPQILHLNSPKYCQGTISGQKNGKG